MNARSQTADLLKGIAVLLMIQVHILELFAANTISGSSIGKILLFLGGPPVAPVFMAIFGYYIAASKKTTGQLMSRGMKIMVLGMLLNIALNLNLIVSVSKGLYRVDLLHYIFGVDVLQFAGISIIFIALVKKTLEKNMLLIIAGIGITAFFGHYLLNYIPERTGLKYISAFFYGSTEWSYFPLFPWLAYPLTGFAFYQAKQGIDLNFLNTVKVRILMGILFVVFLIFTLHYAITISADLSAYYHHGLMFALWTISFLTFYSFFVNRIELMFGSTSFSGYVKWLGKNVTWVYVLQWIITGNVATEIYKTVSSPFYLMISFFVVLIISSVLTYVMIRIVETVKAKQPGSAL